MKLIRIDIDPAEMRRLKVDVSIVADADDGTKARCWRRCHRQGQGRSARTDADAQAKGEAARPSTRSSRRSTI